MKHNLNVLFRTLAAIVGGYLVSAAFSVAFVPVLVWGQICEQNEAVMVVTMLSYIVYFTVIILSFCRKNVWRIWRDIVLTVCLCWTTYYVLGDL
jgi:hypothetical protein